MPDGYLQYTFKRLSVFRQFKVPLWQIDPNYQRLKFSPPGPIIGVAIFGILLIVIIYGMLGTREKGTVLALLIPLLMVTTILGACIWHLRNRSVNCLAFPLRNGPMQFHIWFDLPEPRSFKSFCDALAKATEDAWQNRPPNPESVGLADQIKELQKLRDDKVLTDAEFELAKRKVIGLPPENRSGFR